MARPHFSVTGVLYETLGFAVRRYGTALRVCWLPLVLLMLLFGVVVGDDAPVSQGGLTASTRLMVASLSNLLPIEVTDSMLAFAEGLRLEAGYTTQWLDVVVAADWWLVGAMTIAVILYASYMVPLIRYAATGTPPHRRTMQLEFGWRHAQYALAALISFAAIAFLARFAIDTGMRLIDEVWGASARPTVGGFGDGSLHMTESPSALSGLDAILFELNGILGRLGFDLEVIHLPLVLLVCGVAIYGALKLFAFAPLVAAKEASATYSPLMRSFAVSGGGNLFKLALVVVLFSVLQAVTILVGWAGFQIFALTYVGAESLIFGFDGLTAEDEAPVIRAMLTVIFAAGLVALYTFLAALTAGVGGAVAHRAIR